MKQPSIGEQELDLLRFVSEHAPAALSEIAAEYGTERGLTRSTIHTMLERLRQKGYLTREKDTGVYRYSPRVQKAELLTNLVGEFLRRTLRGSLKPFLAYLTQHAEEVTPEEAEELRKLVKKIDMKE